MIFLTLMHFKKLGLADKALPEIKLDIELLYLIHWCDEALPLDMTE